MATNISNRASITDILAGLKTSQGIESVYSHFTDGHDHGIPFIAYIGAGQSQLHADGKTYWKGNTYQVELYFEKKDEALEDTIEAAFTAGGWNYSKSDDAFLEDEGIYLIYYDLS